MFEIFIYSLAGKKERIDFQKNFTFLFQEMGWFLIMCNARKIIAISILKAPTNFVESIEILTFIHFSLLFYKF